ncbi:DUF4255 domain-containing protein [Streptomyces sp. LRE541]|uniref:DUF4255 domain-containing protein n=1 Tax=Streptomyces sp. LRE541 TaxID=2931983 RepID=UPI00200F3B4D|nr:DUF4255 domain-containing protein [Streptomyces sp. LRE541]UPZ32233.1 DUF4255 domain-containing protein [Streptomyces sp. LRE541]
MSNALAIAHVTQALALLIEANLQPEIDMAVKVEPRKPSADPPPEPTITVFLYQVTPNTSQRGADLPTRASDGTLLKRAAAALDLHFLISAYGDETELVGQRLIGSVVRTLHEIPVLPLDIIELAGEKPYLAESDLAEAAQRVRFTPTVMDIDETSKLWGMLHQTPYTLSVVYQAALVLIEGRETPVAAKPVERSTVRVLPFGAPGAPGVRGAPEGRRVPPGTGDASGAPNGGAPAEATAGKEPAGAAAQAAAGVSAGTAAGTATGAAAGAATGAATGAPVRTTSGKAPVKGVAKTAAKAAARTRKGAQPNKGTQAGRSPRGTAKGTAPATPTDSRTESPTNSTTADGGPDRTER